MSTSEFLNRRQGTAGFRAHAASATSRSPLESVEMLEADNRQLALKLRYLQSVTTIYRQRIAGITHDALSLLGLAPDHVKKITLSIEDAEAVALKAMQNFDEGEAEGGPTNSSPSKTSELRALLHGTGAATTSLPSTRVISTPRRASKCAGHGNDIINKSEAINEADFWRQQFMNLMSEMRPVSMQDAEILMRALTEKKSLAEEVDSLRARLSAGNTEGGGLSPARGAEEGGAAAGFAVASPAPRQVSKASEDAADGTSLGGLVHTPAASVAGAHHHISRSHFNPQVGLVLLTSSSSISKSGGIDGHNGEGDPMVMFAKAGQPTDLGQALRMIREEQTKNKVLRVRLSSLQKQMAAREDTFSSDLIAARTENVRIVASMSAAALKCEALSQQAHECRQKLYANEKTLLIKDGQLQRQITKTEALEKELEAAMKRMQTIFNFDEDRKAAESAELQKALGDQERLLQEMKVISDELQAQQVKQSETVRELNKYQTMLTTAEAVNDQLRAEINAMEQARLMSEWEADSVQSLLPRMEDAATELEQYFTFREVTTECERINGQLRTIAAPSGLLAYLKKVVRARDEEIRLLREEADRAVSLGVPPSVGAIVDTQLLFTSTLSINEEESSGGGGGDGGGEGSADEDELRLLQQRLAGRRHVLLRQEGTWMEIRDVGTGKLRYVTTDVDHTPFVPNSQLIATKKEREAEAAAARAQQSQATAVALSEQKYSEEEMAAKMAEGIAKAVAEERARLEAHYNELLENAVASHDASANATDTNESATQQETNGFMSKEDQADNKPSSVVPPATLHGGAEDLSPSSASLASPHKPRYNPDEPIDPAFRPRLIRFFAKYNPAKLTTVDLVMERFRGRYDYMLKKLVSKYGPEPTEAEVNSSSIELPPQAASVAGVGGTRGVRDERIGLSDVDEDESSPHRKPSNATNKESDSRLGFIQPLRERLIRLLHRYDKPRLAAVDSFINGWVQEGLLKLIAQHGTEPSPSATAPLPRLPPQQPVGGIDPAEDLKLEPYRRRLIRMYDAYDKDRLRTINATMRQNPTAAQCETLLRKLAVRYGPEPPDDADAKIPTLPPQIDEVPPLPAVALQGGQGASSPASPTPIDNALSQSSHAYPLSTNANQSSNTTTTTSYPTEVKARLYRMFKKYAPEKLSNIDLILGSFHGEYDLMFEKLVAKYGAEPEDDGEAVPDDLPQQALNPVLAARQRAVSMRQASPPSVGSGRGTSGTTAAPKQPAASSLRKVPTPSSPSASPANPNLNNSSPLASPKANPAAPPSPKPTAAAAKSSPSLSPQRAKAPPPAAIAAMKAATAAPATSVDDVKTDSKVPTPPSSRSASPAKAIGRPRGTKAPPPSAAFLQARPSAINTDDI